MNQQTTIMEKVLLVKEIIRPVEKQSKCVVAMSYKKAAKIIGKGLLGARISDRINSCYILSL